MVLVLTLLTLLLGSAVSEAQSLLFGWEYPRTDQPEAFLLTVRRGSQHQTWRTTPSAIGDCVGITEPNLYCTRLPQCPALGAADFSIAALRGGSVVPARENPLDCQVLSHVPCQVTCANMPTSPAPVSGGDVVQMPTAEEAPALLSEMPDANGQVPLNIPDIPTRETASLPGFLPQPGLPAFQPAASRAPI